jgi:replicative DNA helicase
MIDAMPQYLEDRYRASRVSVTPDKPSPTTLATEIIDRLFDKISTGAMPQLFRMAALNGLEIGYGLVTVMGAPPGAGKTTLAMQIAFESMEYQPDLRVVVCNRESSMEVLLQRELARRTGVSSRAIRFGSCNATELAKLQKAVDELRPLLARTSSLDEPGELPMLKRLLSEGPGLLILDYIQKFAPSGDAKAGVTEVMSTARLFARAGWAVLALSATSRSQVKGRSAQDSLQLNQASFRDSSEIEFQADAAYLLRDMEKEKSVANVRSTLIECVKNRHGEKNSKLLAFNMPKSCFELRAIDNEYADDFINFNQGEIDYSDVPNPFNDKDGF